MLALTINNTVRRLPDSWETANALAWPCLRDLARFPTGEGKRRAILRLLNLPKRDAKTLTELQWNTLVAGLPWLDLYPLKAPLRNEVRVGFSYYRMPQAHAADVSAFSYTLADEYFRKCLAEGDGAAGMEAARNLQAVLLRPVVNGQRQEVRSRDDVATTAAKLKQLGAEWQAQALMFWGAANLFVNDTYGPWLFANEEDDSDRVKSSAPDLGWWGVWMDVAGDGTFGKLPEVHQHSFHDLCLWLVRQEARARDEQRANTTTPNDAPRI